MNNRKTLHRWKSRHNIWWPKSTMVSLDYARVLIAQAGRSCKKEPTIPLMAPMFASHSLCIGERHRHFPLIAMASATVSGQTHGIKATHIQHTLSQLKRFAIPTQATIIQTGKSHPRESPLRRFRCTSECRGPFPTDCNGPCHRDCVLSSSRLRVGLRPPWTFNHAYTASAPAAMDF
jgi:hypothetical protein